MINLYQNYNKYRNNSIDKKRLTNEELVAQLHKFDESNLIKLDLLGHSLEGREIFQVKLGTGKTKILAWSQMHGDESTATMAILDILNFFSSSDEFDSIRKDILNSVSIYFIPMLNPDGAEKFTRRNALQFDLNRDAIRLQSPEAKILKSTRDRLQPKFGFNLHDQSTYYSAGNTDKQATISFLAPAFNFKKDINEVRTNTMQVIVDIKDELYKIIPGHIGRYNDDFEPRAFGDNMVKWGTSSILIESGGWKNDNEKQFIRKLNFLAILSGFYSIANHHYLSNNIDDYFKIPHNEKLIFDLLIRNASYIYNGKKYIVDVGIKTEETSTMNNRNQFYEGKILELGDLSVFYGIQELDAEGLEIHPGKIQKLQDVNAENLSKDKIYELINEGICGINVNNLDKNLEFSELPINIVVNKTDFNKFSFKLDDYANFYLQKDDELKYSVINGFLYKIKSNENTVQNGLIIK